MSDFSLPPSAARPSSRLALTVGWIALIFLATLLAYGPAVRGGMIWNDSDYVTSPALRSWHGLWLIWFKLGATQQYYPLLHSGFWLEHRLWGDSTTGYHLANIGLHALAACLFAVTLLRLTAPAVGLMPWPWLAGLLFALHPVCVESVAWISEQKNTLSIVFYLLAVLAYLDFDARRRPAAYAAALGLFVCGLMSKSVTATLPAALLVVFWWRRGRLEWRRDVVPLSPWFAIAAVSGLFSAWVERTYIGARGEAFDLGFGQRLLLSGRIVWFYLAKLLWPRNLIFIYPRWRVDGHQAWQYLFLLGVVAVTAGLWLLRRRTRAPLAAFLFFVGSLFPVLGFFNVYAFVFSFVADHWQYLPCLGLIAFAAGTWGGALGRTRSAAAAALLQALAAALVLFLGVLTWRQSRMYDDIQTFYETTLAKNPNCWMAHNNLGNLLHLAGRDAAAIPHFRKTLQLKPDLAEAHNNLGSALRSSGHGPEALAQFREAVKDNPDMADAHANLGVMLAESGQVEAAVKEFEVSLRLFPYQANTHNSYGIILAQLGKNAAAEAHIREALRLDPNYAGAYSNLANVLCQEGKAGESIRWYQQALRLEPGDIDVRNDLGMTLGQLGRFPEAIAQFQTALQHNPNSAQTHFNLYLALMGAGRPDEAFGHYHTARQLDPNVGRQ